MQVASSRMMLYVVALTTIAMVLNMYMLANFRETFDSVAAPSLGSRLARRVDRTSAFGAVGKTYTVVEVERMLTPTECARIISYARASGRLKQAETLDTSNSQLSSYNPAHRTSKTMFIKDHELPEARLMADLAAELSGLPVSHQEDTQVAMYEPGGRFLDHHDACDSSEEVCKRFNNGSGHRVATLLVYLNDGYGGGETVFPAVSPEIVVRPATGKAVFFIDADMQGRNGCDSADGCLLRESLHRGSVVKHGQKWICTKWVHVRPYGERGA